MTVPAPARDLAILLARVAVGAVFLAHGLQKFSANGIEGTAGFFQQAGVPLPTPGAWLSALVETVGGAALIAGAVVPLVGLLLVVGMLGALFFVHIGNGLWVENQGYEFVLTLGAAALLLGAVGAGRYSVDNALSAMRGRTGVTV